MKWSSRAWASAEPSVGSVPAPSSSSSTSVPGPASADDPGDRAQVARERRQATGRRTVRRRCRRRRRARRAGGCPVGRHVQAGLVHQREQAKGPQGHGLAPGVRPGHDQRRVAVAEPDVDRDHAAGQARMAGAQEARLRARRPSRRGSASISVGQARLGGPEVEAGERVQRLAQGLGLAADERRQLVEDPLDLRRFGHLGLAPGIAQLDGNQRLDEQRLAAAGGVVDDALHAAPGVRPDRHHVAAVAQRDDRFLERAAPAPRLTSGRAGGAAGRTRPGRAARRPPEPRRRGVQQLARPGRSSGPASSAGPGAGGARAQIAEQRSAVVGEDVRQPGRGIQRLGDRQELRRLQASTASRPLDRTGRCRGRRRSPPRAVRRGAPRAWSSRRAAGRRAPGRRPARGPRPGGGRARRRSRRRAARG